jgi:hypothetical protein
MSEITAAIASELLRYDPETGELWWKERTPENSAFASEGARRFWNTKHAGRRALATSRGCGYLTGSLLDRQYATHRIAWLIAKGSWPRNHIDHINGDRADNRLANLREATKSDNGKNQRLSAANTSGVNGVVWEPRHRRWIARIKVNGRPLYIGTFSCIGAAACARAVAEMEHGFHPNHGAAGRPRYDKRYRRKTVGPEECA